MRPVLTCCAMALQILSAQDLTVVETILRRSEGGPPVADPVFNRGEPVFLTFRVGGFRALPGDKLINVSYTITTLDPSKRPLAEPAKGEVRAELAPEDKNWTPIIPYEVMIPPAPEPGTYSILIEIQDLVAVRRTSSVKTFEVKAPKLSLTDAFAITNFRFQRTERAATGLGPDEAFARGDTLWARFDMAGYRFGPKNAFSIQYGFVLKDATGKLLFEQPEAAAETGEGFYPKLYTSGLFSLQVGPAVAPGEYTLIVHAKDLTSGQTAESGHVFRVR